ncbi:hypothetical protein NVI2019_PEGOAJLN_00695 [Providencia alcalifaciens]|nr:hypothetical protein NVI2019_PEGOAJLN_00695 [Providencia alcalifaciens]
MSEESLRKALKEYPEWVKRYLGLDKPLKTRTRHVSLFFSIVILVMGFIYG